MSTQVIPRTSTKTMSTLSQTRQRTTVPSPGRYTRSSATWPVVPHTPQVPTAVVISVPNSSISIPPIALPSSTASSSVAITDLLLRGARRAEPLGLDPQRRVAERDQVRGHGLYEVRRAAHVGQRRLRHGPGHLRHHRRVHSPGITGPAGRLLTGQRVDDLHGVWLRTELGTVDHVGQ